MPWPPRILTNRLILSKPGSRLCPPHYYLLPRIFRPSYGPALHSKHSVRSRRLHDVSTTQLNMTLSYIETGTEIETDRHLYNDVTLLLLP